MRGSPNPRLQRTRSRAPLSRKPLGATRSAVLWCALVTLAGGCASAGLGGAGSLEGVAVSSAGKPQAEVVVTVARQGEIRTWIAVTGADGSYSFPRVPTGTYWIRYS